MQRLDLIVDEPWKLNPVAGPSSVDLFQDPSSILGKLSRRSSSTLERDSEPSSTLLIVPLFDQVNSSTALLFPVVWLCRVPPISKKGAHLNTWEIHICNRHVDRRRSLKLEATS